MAGAKLSHEGRVALVTGAARGIGQAIALRLAERGARLVLVDLSEASETAGLIAGETLTIAADVSRASDWKRIDDTTQQKFGGTDIVVNNAGIGGPTDIEELDIEKWRHIFSINLDAHFPSAKQFVPQRRLGLALQLPAQLEPMRPQIEAVLSCGGCARDDALAAGRGPHHTLMNAPQRRSTTKRAAS